MAQGKNRWLLIQFAMVALIGLAVYLALELHRSNERIDELIGKYNELDKAYQRYNAEYRKERAGYVPPLPGDKPAETPTKQP